MSRPIIPKTSSNTKLKLWGNVTFWDAIMLLVFAIVAVLVAVSLSIIGVIGQIVVGIMLFIVLSIFLIPFGKRHTKLYVLIWRAIKFKSQNNKYVKGGANDTKNRIPYKELSGVDGQLNLLRTKGGAYVGMIEVFGENIDGMDEGEIELALNRYKEIAMRTTKAFDVKKVMQPFNLSDSANYLESLIGINNEDKTLTDEQKTANNKQLKGYLNEYTRAGGSLSANNLSTHYYLAIYGNTPQECNESIENFTNFAAMANLQPRRLEGWETFNVAKVFIDPSKADFDKKTILNANTDKKLDELIAASKETVYGNYIKQSNIVETSNGPEEHTFYKNYGLVYEMPGEPGLGWARVLMEGDRAVSMNFKPVNRENLKSQLGKILATLRANKQNLKGKTKEFEGTELDKQIEDIQEIMDDVANDRDNVLNMSIVVLNYARSAQLLQQRINSYNKAIGFKDFALDDLKYQQDIGYEAILPKTTNRLLNKNSKETTGTTFGWAIPWNTQKLQDLHGFKIGHDASGEPVLLDVFSQEKRANSNMFIIGTSGSGKTTLSKLLITQHLAADRNVLILDPEREYKPLVDYFHGTWVDVGNGGANKLNPLQFIGANIDHDISELVKNKNGKIDYESINNGIVSDHAILLDGFMSILFPFFSNTETMIQFTNCLSKFYKDYFKKDYKTKVLEGLEANEYPTFSDFADWLNKPARDKGLTAQDLVELNKVRNVMVSEFVGTGKYASLYDGHSTVVSGQQGLVVFDINDLLEKGKREVINAQLLLLTGFIQNEVKNNRRRNAAIDDEARAAKNNKDREKILNKKKKQVVVFDEAHLLIDEQNPVALNFIFQLVKRIRKYDGGTQLITQNPRDFVATEEIAKKTTAIVTNSQYAFILKLKPNDIEPLNKMFDHQLTNADTAGIKEAPKGRALLINGDEKLSIQVDIDPFVQEAAEIPNLPINDAN